jgi:hypothetical protein
VARRRHDPDQDALFDPGPATERVRRVRRGVDQTVKALRSTGRLEPVDTALVAIARTLADAMDIEHTAADGSAYTVASIAGRLHPVVAELRGERLAGFDDIDALLDQMRADPATYADGPG